MTARSRRWLTLALAPIVAAAITVAAPPPAVSAAPSGSNPPGSTAEEGDDDPLLSNLLDDTGRRFVQAQNTYKRSVKLQVSKSVAVRAAEAERDALLPAAGEVASESYRTGSLSSVGFLLNSVDSNTFVQRAMSLNEINSMNDRKLRELNASVERVEKFQRELDEQIALEKSSLRDIENQKKAAEKAFALIGGPVVTKGLVSLTSKDAAPAPRDSDGDLPKESCSVPDPTTSGCITPRTYHMYKEVRKAGFDKFVGCHRNGGPFEHPKGRACDWSLQESGFAPWKPGPTFRYGNELMAFLVRNAEALGILYVIWNRQIWFPTRGWSRYHGPSAHIDHVHVSML